MSKGYLLVESSNGSRLTRKEHTEKGYKWTYERHCDRCDKVYSYDNDTVKNIFTSKYCDECKQIIKREKSNERVRRYRERKRESNK